MKVRSFAAILLLALAAWQLGAAAHIHAKALLAQELLERAWHRTLEGEGPVRPWPWADIHPVARLSIPGQGRDLIVLEGASGQALAFGPAHVLGTALPGEAGSSAIVGHRDTHFRFLRDLRSGERIELERHDGTRLSYRVSALRIVDSRRERLPLETEVESLRLITCYPFEAVRPGGPLRIEVIAKPEYGSGLRAGVASRQRILSEHKAESRVTILTKIRCVMSLRDRVENIIRGGDQSAAEARARYRDTAMNWIALGVLLSAWHMEGRIDRTLGVQSNAHVAKSSNGRGTQPLWDNNPRGTSWISRAASGGPSLGLRHVVPPTSVYTPVGTLRMIRRWLPGI